MQKLEDSDSADDSSENDTKLAGRLKKNRLQTMGKYYRSSQQIRRLFYVLPGVGKAIQ